MCRGGTFTSEKMVNETTVMSKDNALSVELAELSFEHVPAYN